MIIFGSTILILLINHYLSYIVLKNRVLRRNKWDLNICCGKTDGGGINADIFKHEDVPNFVLVDNIYNLPFKNNQFENVLCSHTMEHVENPPLFYKELKRVGKKITIILPPLWDISAVFCFFEHRWIFLTFRKEHKKLPKYVKLPIAEFIQKKRGQKIKA